MDKKDIGLVILCAIVMVIAFQNLKPVAPPPGQQGMYSEEVQGPVGDVVPDEAAEPAEPVSQAPRNVSTSGVVLGAEFADLKPAEPVVMTAGDYAVYTFDPEAGGLTSVVLNGLDMTVGHPDIPMMAVNPEGGEWHFSHARILEKTETTLKIARQLLDQPLVMEQTWTLNANADVPYVLNYEVVLRNIGETTLKLAPLTMQAGVMHDLGTPKGFMGSGGIDQTVDIRLEGKSSPKSIQLKKVKSLDEEERQEWLDSSVDWIGVQNKYFATIVDRANPDDYFSGTIMSSQPVVDLKISKNGATYIGHVLRRESDSRGVKVQLTSSDPEAVSVPATVTIGAGQTAVTFAIEANGETPDMPVTLTARADGFASTYLNYPPERLTDHGEATAMDDLIEASVVLDSGSLDAGKSLTQSMQIYIGPKKFDLLKALGDGKQALMRFDLFLFFHLKAFEYISLVILWMLMTFHGIFNSYGVAILLITFILRLVFWPITHRSTVMSRKMQAIGPIAKEMREKYKGDPQKLHQKTMELYKEHKVNPMSGCLPAILQIPAFFALFNVLRSAMELRHASFLWAGDLSLPDTVAVLPLVFFELPINPLAIIMGVTMILQMKIVPTTADPSQQRLMMIMSGSFLIFLYSMPSGLTLYWAANQILNMVQYRITHNMMDKEVAGVTAKKTK